MSVLDALDATRICTRWSKPLDDPAAWMVPAPVIARREPVPRLLVVVAGPQPARDAGERHGRCRMA